MTGRINKSLVTQPRSSIVLELDSKLDFGKHKDESAEIMALHDPGYLFWLVRNIPAYRLSPTLKELAENSMGESAREGPIEAYGFDPCDPAEMDW